MTWANMTHNTSGPRPSPRDGHGIAWTGSQLFIFGGHGPVDGSTDCNLNSASCGE